MNNRKKNTNSKKGRQLVVVLGSHRSGTSAITRALKVVNVDLGNNLMPEAADNPRGFWEDIDIYSLNSELLNFLGMDWDSLTPVSDAGFSLLRENGFLLRAAEMLRAKIGDAEFYGIKDPRLSILLPFWRKVFQSVGVKEKYILAIRHPRSVAASLATRNSMDIRKGYALWLGHTLLSLSETTNNNPLLVDYDRLLVSADNEIERIASSFCIGVNAEELNSYKDGFLSKNLRHTVYEKEDLALDPDCPQMVAEMYTALLDVAADVLELNDKSFQEKLKAWLKEYERLKPELLLIDNYSSTLCRLSKEKVKLDEQLAHTIHNISVLDARIVSLEHAKHDRDAQIASLEVSMHDRDAQIASLELSLNERDAQIIVLNQVLRERDTEIAHLYSANSWRITRPLRWSRRQTRIMMGLGRQIVKAIMSEGGYKKTISKALTVYRREGISGLRRVLLRVKASNLVDLLPDEEDKARAIFVRQQAEVTRVSARKLIAEMPNQPLISIIMPVYNTPIKWLQRAVISLQHQFYENWELCVVDDCSPTNEQRDYLADLAKYDSRIRLAAMASNSGISAASNYALEMASGEFIALVDHDDEITPDALFWMVEAINANSDVDFLYSDECKIDDTSNRRLYDFVLKPDWSPEIMFNFMITGHLTIYRTSVARETGGFRSDYDFSQDYDLALRMADVSRRVIHVERILYLWRAISGSAAAGGKDFARISNVAALADSLVRHGIHGSVEMLPHANRVSISIPDELSRITIVIPSDSVANLRLALNAIREGTDYINYEVRVVCNSAVASELEVEYKKWPILKFVRYDKPFNFSDKCNEGARAADGDILIFYNDDVFPIGRDWMERLIEYLFVPGVGGTSPQLLYENGTIQYAGMISGAPGMAGTAYHARPFDHCDDFLSMNRLVRNVSILSGACCAMRRDLFFKIGGFDQINTPDGHSDLDLSYKIQAAGQRCVYTPYSLLKHIGNHSWISKDYKYKADIYCLKRWGRYISRDPYFTDTMRNVLYQDYTFDYRIYAEQVNPESHYTGQDILFISHELTNTGAPHMVLAAVKAVKAAGGFPVVVAPVDGPLRAAFQAEGVSVIIDSSVTLNHVLFERFACNFDVVFVSTFALRQVIEQLAKIRNLRVIWWLHESKVLTESLANVQPSVLNNIEVVCVSEYARSCLPKRIPAHILHNGLQDYTASITSSKACKKFVFLLVGTIEPRKGQDIFVEAIIGLPLAMRSACQFVMVGKLWPGNEEFWCNIHDNIYSYDEITYLGDLSHKDVLALIGGCDVLVSCSRDDAFSLVAIEAAQFGKPSILSDHVGVREVLGDECTFVFPSGNVSKLRDRLMEAYESPTQLKKMGVASRRVYDAHLNEQAFNRRFMHLIEPNDDAFQCVKRTLKSSR